MDIGIVFKESYLDFFPDFFELCSKLSSLYQSDDQYQFFLFLTIVCNLFSWWAIFYILNIVAENYIFHGIPSWEIVCVRSKIRTYNCHISKAASKVERSRTQYVFFLMKGNSCNILVSNFSYIVNSHPYIHYFYN